MKFKGSKTEYNVEINVDPEAVFAVVLDTVAKAHGIGKDWCVKDGKLIENVEYHTSHSWDVDEVRVEKPTRIQLQGARVIERLRAQKRAGSIKL
jgi:hypothetical protein